MFSIFNDYFSKMEFTEGAVKPKPENQIWGYPNPSLNIT